MPVDLLFHPLLVVLKLTQDFILSHISLAESDPHELIAYYLGQFAVEIFDVVVIYLVFNGFQVGRVLAVN